MIELFPIIRTRHESDRSGDFIALANTIENLECNHAGFVISYNNELFVFHFTGIIQLGPVDDDYFHRITPTILPDEVPSFIAHCKHIHKTARPIYGYFYSGESYTLTGIHTSSTQLGQRMTCVGFCLNVLKGFLEDDYIIYQDWTEQSHNEPGYLERYCDRHDLDIDNIRQSHRRISPIEFLVSAFFADTPITKAQIDSRVDLTNRFLRQKLQSNEEE